MPGADGGHGLLGAFKMEDFLPKSKVPARDTIREEKEEIRAEVRGIIRSVL